MSADISVLINVVVHRYDCDFEKLKMNLLSETRSISTFKKKRRQIELMPS